MPEECAAKQKSIEQYFQDHDITDPDLKMKILPSITRLIYDRNTEVAHYEKEDDDYKKMQSLNDCNELDQKINEIIKDLIKK